MKVLIYNKARFNDFMVFNGIDDSNVESKDMLVISINNPYIENLFPERGNMYSHFKRNHSNVLIMHFPDFGENISYEEISRGNYSVFNEYKAKRLYEFIKKNKDKKLAVLHCGAGISRSGAIGLFIHDLYGTMTNEEFKRKNPQIQPNYYILDLLWETARRDSTLIYKIKDAS